MNAGIALALFIWFLDFLGKIDTHTDHPDVYSCASILSTRLARNTMSSPALKTKF